MVFSHRLHLGSGAPPAMVVMWRLPSTGTVAASVACELGHAVTPRLVGVGKAGGRRGRDRLAWRRGGAGRPGQGGAAGGGAVRRGMGGLGAAVSAAGRRLMGRRVRVGSRGAGWDDQSGWGRAGEGRFGEGGLGTSGGGVGWGGLCWDGLAGGGLSDEGWGWAGRVLGSRGGMARVVLGGLGLAGRNRGGLGWGGMGGHPRDPRSSAICTSSKWSSTQPRPTFFASARKNAALNAFCFDRAS